MRLSCGDWRLTLRPDLGGSVEALTWGDVPILRPTPPGTRDILQTACFPLVPYANRIMGGGFAFDGRDVRLPVLDAFAPHALHGDGWLAPWRVGAQAADSATLIHDHVSGAWPWAYRATQTFTLSEAGLRMDLSLRNGADEPAPAGLGLHPYFPRGAATRLTLCADGAWDATSPDVPWRPIVAGDAMDWSGGRRVEDAPFIDHAYSGWDGCAHLDQGDHAVRIAASDNCPIAQVYAPTGADFLCVEAVTHRPDALNGAPGERGAMAVLQPGETLAISLSLSLTTG